MSHTHLNIEYLYPFVCVFLFVLVFVLVMLGHSQVCTVAISCSQLRKCAPLSVMFYP